MPKMSREVDSFKGDFSPDLTKLVHESIRLFFEDKTRFDGTPIPSESLFSEHSFNTVLKSMFDGRTFDYIHCHCLSQLIPPDSYSSDGPGDTWGVRFLLSLLRDLKSKGLPKEFQPGLLLLYFKFCMGMRIPPPPLL